MFMDSIKRLAGDCERTHRWCRVNLTEDTANDDDPLKLSHRRVVRIGRVRVTVMGGDGTVDEVEPARIQQVW